MIIIDRSRRPHAPHTLYAARSTKITLDYDWFRNYKETDARATPVKRKIGAATKAQRVIKRNFNS